MSKKFKALFKEQLTQGVTPHSLALSCALAMVISTFPFAGTTWIIIAVLAFTLKLNQPLVQGLNQLLTPFWLLMLPVYLRIGEWIVGAKPISVNPSTILEQATHNWKDVLINYGMAGVHASLAWLIVGPAVGFLVYRGSLPIFENLQKNFRAKKELLESSQEIAQSRPE